MVDVDGVAVDRIKIGFCNYAIVNGGHDASFRHREVHAKMSYSLCTCFADLPVRTAHAAIVGQRQAKGRAKARGVSHRLDSAGHAGIGRRQIFNELRGRLVELRRHRQLNDRLPARGDDDSLRHSAAFKIRSEFLSADLRRKGNRRNHSPTRLIWKGRQRRAVQSCLGR